MDSGRTTRLIRPPTGRKCTYTVGNRPVGAIRPPTGRKCTYTVGNRPVGEKEARKIGSIGVHVSRGVTTHGLAINVNNDLQPFEWIVPCGIEGARATSVSRERGAEQDLNRFADTVAERFGDLFARTVVKADHAELMARAELRDKDTAHADPALSDSSVR